MDDPILSQIEQLPVEVQVTWLSKLTIPDLLSVYNVSLKLRHLLNRKDVLRFISQANEIETWYDFVISELSLMTPRQLYDLYHSNQNVKPYMNDLRITIKFVVFGLFFSFYCMKSFTIDDVIDSIKSFPSSHNYNIDTLINRINTSYQQPIKFRDSKIIIEEPTNSATQGKRAVLGTNCSKLSRLMLLNVLERTGHNIMDFTNHSKHLLCTVIQDYAKSVNQDMS
jgi:hypothetical protein